MWPWIKHISVSGEHPIEPASKKSRILVMNTDEKAKTVELIRRIQSGTGSDEDLSALEKATGNPNVWTYFDAFELEGFSPEKLFILLGGKEETQIPDSTTTASVRV